MKNAEYYISTDNTKLDFEVIYNYLSNTYWAKGIPRDVLQKAIDNSLCFAVYNLQQHQVGFARVITDKATFAYLADVFILPQYQGQGLAKLLIKTVVEYPQLQGLRRFMLATSDAHGLYKKFGFTALNDPSLFLHIAPQNIYNS